MQTPEYPLSLETAAVARSAPNAVPLTGRTFMQMASTADIAGDIITCSNPDIGSGRSRTAYSPIVLAGVLRIIDITVIAILGFVCSFWAIAATHMFTPYLVATIGISLFTVLIFQSADLYQLKGLRSFYRQSVRLILAWSIVFASAVALLRFTQWNDGSVQRWGSLFYVFGLAALVALRGAASLLVRRWTKQGRFDRRTVIIGAGDRGDTLIAQLLEQPNSDVRIIGVFDDRSDDRTGGVGNGMPKLGKVDDLFAFARHTRIDLVIVGLPLTAEERILQMLKKLWVLPLDIRLAAHGSKLQFRPRSYSYIGKVPLFDVFDRPIADWDVVTKWIFDRTVGALALFFLAPIMLAIAVFIKIESKGPILFRQRRYGFNNEIIDVYKFRSIYVEHSDELARNIVVRNDPRVTRVGRFLRRTSLDELPQLFNVVFTGDMSLVGPRPHPVYGKAEGVLFNEVVDGYFARHRVKPGITGWAQINGWRGGADSYKKIHSRVEHDLYYIENWSILFDLCILARTPFALFGGENAY